METFAAVYTSDLSRAHDTARLIVAANENDSDVDRIRTTDMARERCFGVLEGKGVVEFSKEAKEAGMTKKPWKFTPEGAETVEQVRARAKMFFKVGQNSNTSDC